MSETPGLAARLFSKVTFWKDDPAPSPSPAPSPISTPAVAPDPSKMPQAARAVGSDQIVASRASQGLVAPQGISATRAGGGTAPNALRLAFDALPGGSSPGRVHLLEDNTEAWVHRWKRLNDATQAIDAFYFSVENDAFGMAFLGLLMKKAREGKKVRLGMDDVARIGGPGFKGTSFDYLDEVADAGVDLRIYHPIIERGALKLINLSFFASNHDKIMVVDGQHSFTGGRNLGRDYYRRPEDDPTTWRDMDVYVSGPGTARSLTEAFEREFNDKKVSRKVWGDILGNWRKRDLVLMGAYLMMDMWMHDPPLSEAEVTHMPPADKERHVASLVDRALRRMPSEGIDREAASWEQKKLREIAAELVDNPRLRGSSQTYAPNPTAMDAAEVAILDRTSAAADTFDTLAEGLKTLSAGTTRRIVIVNPYVVLPESTIELLAEIGRRGVKIYLGTNSPLSTDSTITQAFFLEDWAKVLARVPNLRLFVATGQRKFHLKAATLDSNVTFVSTYNADFLSMYVNSEIGAAIWSKSFAKKTTGTFIDDKENPANGFVEYTIKRDAEGNPILKDGEPIVEFGPEHHLSQEILEQYELERTKANIIRALPWFDQLERPRTEDALRDAAGAR